MTENDREREDTLRGTLGLRISITLSKYVILSFVCAGRRYSGLVLGNDPFVVANRSTELLLPQNLG
jgi:hypothetical protein